MSKLPKNISSLLSKARTTVFYNALTKEIYKGEVLHVHERFCIN